MMTVIPPLPRLLRTLVACVGVWLALVGGVQAADEFLEPEKAYQFSAQVVAPDRIEVRFAIHKGYYLYREQFRFDAEGASLGPAAIPPGKVKFDENFQKNVETYRDEIRIGVPLVAAQGPFTLKVVSQGCADAGLCYPPMTSTTTLDPTRIVAAAPAVPAGAGSWTDGAVVDEVLRSGRFWRVVGVFFVMGLLLSFTPCVLPMLPILSSIIAGSSQTPGRLRGLALAGSYALGMALVYTALGVAAGLAGEGLAATLQTPWALGTFAALLVFFALSMFDVYELRLPARFTSSMAAHSQRLPAGRLAGVFAMGALSALIVSPCVSAPLAGALLYISQSGNVGLGGTALFTMAAGMSVPLLLLGASSGQWLPKSGPWMHAVKRLFGVLMIGVAIWIVQPVLPPPLALAMWGLLLLMVGFMLDPFSTHAHHHHAARTWAQRALGVAALTMGVAQIVGAASGGRDPLQPLEHLGGMAASATAATGAAAPAFQRVRSVSELDDVLARADRTVMLDFYADWCVSCKEMERFTFSRPEIAARMSRAILLKADVTENNAQDRELLRRFKLFGPPGTVFFGTGGREIAGTRVIGFLPAARFADVLKAAGL